MGTEKFESIMFVIVLLFGCIMFVCGFIAACHFDFMLGYPIFMLVLFICSFMITTQNPIQSAISIFKNIKDQNLLTLILFIFGGWIYCILFAIAFVIAYVIYTISEIKIKNVLLTFNKKEEKNEELP